ncbi:MAG: mercuric ion binding protein [Flavobacteriaceae bacterium]|jgi:mercuric ion binding protein|tara:strand:- start:3079 stop:3456 length:378 start_codon:yes stop_codon:yes gene_type:complete
MKKAFIVFIISSSILLGRCQKNQTPKVVVVSIKQESPEEIEIISKKSFAKLRIEGMTCAIGCAATIEKKLQKTSGISSVKVDFETKTAWVTYDPSLLSLNGISTVVKETGTNYSVTGIELLQRTD